ncbi:MAG TPA: GAF domain-containing protein [Jiangellaceae bacterium]
MGDVMRARERDLSGDRFAGVRQPIRASWQRARREGLRADSYLPPIALAGADVDEARRRHPLGGVWPLLRRSLRWATVDPGALVFLSDADGHLLWVEGERATMHRAENVHLLPGAKWSEDVAGTSGIGTSLTLQRPFQVLGAEHFLSAATAYTCTAAPIHDPQSGALIGAVDFTCPAPTSGPLAFSLLTTAARLAETTLLNQVLRDQARLRDRYIRRVSRRLGTRSALVGADGQVIHADPPGWLPRGRLRIEGEGGLVLPDGRSLLVERLAEGGPYLVVENGAAELDPQAMSLHFDGLGRARGRIRLAGVEHELSQRHSELVVALLVNPRGLSAAALAAAVYGPRGKSVTVRAELARLRQVLGHRLESAPYRITGAVSADFLVPAARTDTLLPGSLAPVVETVRTAR